MQTMSTEERLTLREARDQLGKRVDAAFYGGETTVITKNGEPRAVLIPIRDYKQCTEQGC
jgi:prevent-host-death family protein